MRGPLVLMAVRESQAATQPRITREQMLAATRVSERQWQANAANGPVTLLPFTWLGSRPYTTYVNVS
jgi:hypothetical protein